MTKPRTLTIRITPAERKSLERAAQRKGVRVGPFVRDAALAAAGVAPAPRPAPSGGGDEPAGETPAAAGKQRAVAPAEGSGSRTSTAPGPPLPSAWFIAQKTGLPLATASRMLKQANGSLEKLSDLTKIDWSENGSQ